MVLNESGIIVLSLTYWPLKRCDVCYVLYVCLKKIYTITYVNHNVTSVPPSLQVHQMSLVHKINKSHTQYAKDSTAQLTAVLKYHFK